MLLPSHEHGPHASPHLLRGDDDGAASGRSDRLHPWVVPTATFGAFDAVEFLLGLPGGDEPGLAIGDSPRFLAEISKLALELLARGRVMPMLACSEDRWVARWEPVATDPGDAERLQLLAESMPPLLRAEVGLSEHSRTPEKIVDGALGAFVDACARRFLTDPLLPRVARRRAPSSVEAWITALTAADPVVAEDGLGVAALSEQLDAWRDALDHYAAHRTFRTCFRLSAPEEPASPIAEEPWRVEILLQEKDDPSVLVPAQDVWSSNGDGLRVLGRLIEDPQERLLGGLGHALRLWPDLEPALREVAPTGVALDTDAAFRFLRDAVPALEQAGFGVLSPAWWDKRLRLKLTAEPFKEWEEGSGLFGLDGLCAYEWRIAVGDATLSVSELRELAAMKLPLVMSRGQWIVLRSEDVEAALKFFEGRKERGEAPAAELLRESLALDAGRDDLPPTEIEGTGWLSELLGQGGERKLRQIPTPGDVRRRAAALPGARARVAVVPLEPRPRGMSRGRHGSRKDAADAGAAARRARGPLLAKAPEPDPPDLPGVGARQLAARGRALRAEPARARAPRPGAIEGPRVRGRGARCGSRADDLRAGDTRPRDAGRRQVGAGRARRGAEHQDERREADAGDPLDRCPPSDRADGHAGREPLDRAPLDHGLPQSGAARPGGDVQTLLRDADRALPRPAARPSVCGRRPARSSCAG